ncbi:MAG: FKBP-type peptidyl-prolyl cis-trans isomerase [Phycisphaeraceae bacterium]|nr:FKBP-type peptidyl-prolyl cis-trans isomerase [Phycisphaerales bacterium]MCA9306715.1 FKBP-type peptidyl-prolyl cis-trans isomerase [Phycisphaerales bacterium]MCB9841914.1 FKBP-type peptidyl-prolyl cis-trans isomerase [Phycisphaeraceae bacterium]
MATGFVRVLILVTCALAMSACSDRAIELSPDKSIKFEDQVVGTGPPVKEGSMIRAHYVVRLPNGDVVVNTRSAGKGDPHIWQVGTEAIIPGMNKAVIGMRMGGVRKATLPPRAGYGRMGYADKVPPNTDLIVYIELESIIH